MFYYDLTTSSFFQFRQVIDLQQISDRYFKLTDTGSPLRWLCNASDQQTVRFESRYSRYWNLMFIFQKNTAGNLAINCRHKPIVTAELDMNRIRSDKR